MYAFDRDGVLVGMLGDFEASHPKNYKGAEMPLIGSVFSKVPKDSIIISNQAGIDRGYTSLEIVKSQFDWLMRIQPNFVGAFFCPDDGKTAWYRANILEDNVWRKATTGYNYRKPSDGMGVLAHDIGLPPITHYIGDLSGHSDYADGRNSDRLFGQNLECEYLDVNDFLA